MKAEKTKSFKDLIKLCLSGSHNPDRVIFIFSLHKVTDDGMNALFKGLDFFR